MYENTKPSDLSKINVTQLTMINAKSPELPMVQNKSVIYDKYQITRITYGKY